jgi:hypothetical protein
MINKPTTRELGNIKMSVLNVLKFETSENQSFLDARGPRFGAAITTLLLALLLITESWALLAYIFTAFALGAFIGPKATPQALIFSKIIKPRLKGQAPLEDVRPPHFAQVVGFIFILIAATAYLLDISALFIVAVGGALAAAFLNAAFNYCLGCELYLLLARFRSWISRSKSVENSYNLPSL